MHYSFKPKVPRKDEGGLKVRQPEHPTVSSTMPGPSVEAVNAGVSVHPEAAEYTPQKQILPIGGNLL